MFNIAFLVENVLTTLFPVLCSFTYFSNIFADLHIFLRFRLFAWCIFLRKYCRIAKEFVID